MFFGRRRYNDACEILMNNNYIIREIMVNHGAGKALLETRSLAFTILGAQLAMIDLLLKPKEKEAVEIKKTAMKRLVKRNAPKYVKEKAEALTYIFYKCAVDEINFYAPSGMRPSKAAAKAMIEVVNFEYQKFGNGSNVEINSEIWEEIEKEIERCVKKLMFVLF